MSTPLTVTEWFKIIDSSNNDLELAKQLIADLVGYHPPRNGRHEKEDLQQLLNLFTAIRLDQMAKENRSTPI